MVDKDLEIASAFEVETVTHTSVAGEVMYAISLWQPWASFIAAGLKPYETRDWKPPAWLIGKRIAIHAAKKAPARDDYVWAFEHGAADLPLGAVVCTAVLCGAYQVGGYGVAGKHVINTVPGSPALGQITTDAFGDYGDNRWVWWLTEIERLAPAIPAKGAQGFWKWKRSNPADDRPTPAQAQRERTDTTTNTSTSTLPAPGEG